jgi:hypothetical protein
MKNINEDLIPGKLYKVKSNQYLNLWHPQTELKLIDDKHCFIEPIREDGELAGGEVFLYLGERIGPSRDLYIYKILYKNWLYYAIIKDEDFLIEEF